MRLRAEVENHLRKTRHRVGGVQPDGSFAAKSLPIASWLEIVDEQEGVYLFHYDSDGVCVADTWHQSVEEAKQQAEFEFGVDREGWVKLEKER